jgi:glycosyltransferase involved in cell wall biosynthesis
MVKARCGKSSRGTAARALIEPGPDSRAESASLAVGAPNDQAVGDEGVRMAAANTALTAAPPEEIAGGAGVSPSGRRELRGRIEKATTATIGGWAWDPQVPDKRIRLELVEGEKRLAVAVADRFRQELVPLGCGDGRYGFDMELEAGLLSEDRHVLTLRCADTGAAMPGSPVVFAGPRVGAETGVSRLQAGARGAKPAFRSYIDKVTDRQILGWIMCPDRPLHRYVVALKEGERVLVRTVASRFRFDLLTGGAGDGCYAFVFDPPASLADGQEHLLDVVEEDSGISITTQPLRWHTDPTVDKTTPERVSPPPAIDISDYRGVRADRRQPDGVRQVNIQSAAHVGMRILFDISDLVYYIGHHANLTGIQRVQSSIVLAMVDAKEFAPASVFFLSFSAATRNWMAIPVEFLISLLRDLFLPEPRRLVNFSTEAARYGVLPGAQAFDGDGVLDDGNPSVLCLLGAAWVNQDYLHRVLSLKRRFGTRFVMTIHDLIPIYARDTCDQDTTRVFEAFMRRALRHADHILAVSESTAKDVRRYLGTLQLPEPPITVTKNGSSFEEFLPGNTQVGSPTLRDLPGRFVLFVGTIEGRKNHQFIFDIWRRMVETGDDPPHLVCVGRLGWKAAAFVSVLVETNYLDRRIHLLREIPDTDLRLLFARCLFTVCPSLYEGWGLPVGEALAMGKICVCSERASIPEVAGDCGVYIDIGDADRSLQVIRELIRDRHARDELEAKIARDYVPITWRSVALRVAAACHSAAAVEWQDPYPFADLPYSTEISFGRLDLDIDGKGESLLARIVDARLGHFKFDTLDQRSFLLGEEIRSDGFWAPPESWGAWLCQLGGVIEFSLGPEPSELYYVFVRLRVSGPLQEMPVRLFADGVKVWEGEVGANSKDVVVRIARSASGIGRWRVRIGAEVEVSSEVRTQIGATDTRIPTIGLERLVVVPERDVATRLDILTKRIS